jgi:hypothetical protein
MVSENEKLECSPEAAALVPLSIAREIGFFPLSCSPTSLTVAVEAPLADEVRDRLRYVFEREICAVVYPRAAIQEAIDHQLERFEPEEGVDDVSICWLWPDWNYVKQDGTLVIKCSGWHDGCHWSGAREIPPDAPDYAFWEWLTTEKDYARLVDNRELPEVRKRWERQADSRS